MDVTEVDAFEHLPENAADSVFVEPSSVGTLIEIIKHRVIDELKHQVQVLLATENFNQIHKVLVS